MPHASPPRFIMCCCLDVDVTCRARGQYKLIVWPVNIDCNIPPRLTLVSSTGVRLHESHRSTTALKQPLCAPHISFCTTRRGGRLQAKYVIHTVGPVYEDAEASAPMLASAYK